jgi:hypothetical protein
MTEAEREIVNNLGDDVIDLLKEFEECKVYDGYLIVTMESVNEKEEKLERATQVGLEVINKNPSGDSESAVLSLPDEVTSVQQPSEYTACGYTHDVTDKQIFGDLSGEVWNCQHPSEEGSEYCLFHQAPEDRESEPVKRFCDVINKGYSYEGVELPAQEQLRFIGADFGELSIPSSIYPPYDEDVFIDLRDASLGLVCHSADIGCRVLLNGATLGGVSISETTISGDLDIGSADIDGTLSFEDVNVHGDINLSGTDIGGRDTQVETRHRRGRSFKSEYSSGASEGIEVTGDVLFESADVSGEFAFHLTEVGGNVSFDDTEFRRGTYISIFEVVEGDVSFRETIVCSGDASIFSFGGKLDGDLMCDGIEVDDETDFSVDVGGDFVLSDSEFKGDVDSSDTDIGGGIDCGGMKVSGQLDFRRSNFGGGGQFYGAKIGGDLLLMGVDTGGKVNIEDGVVEGDVWTEKSNINAR